MVSKRNFAIILVSLLALFLVYSPIAKAQNWVAMPPYNTLWPLWSPALSPVDPLTGLPEPIVTELVPSTILDVEPGLTWDPALPNPWLLYNTPIGMAYYDPLFGINLWPPAYLLDAVGDPILLPLPPFYDFLPPTDPLWLFGNVPPANAAALLYLETNFGPLAPPPIYLDPAALI
ncbi:MAG: hypothetical protein AB1611_08770 [bacterium]